MKKIRLFYVIVLLLGCSHSEATKTNVAIEETQSVLGDADYVLTRSDSLLSLYFYLENDRYGIALTLEEAVALGISESSYAKSVKQLEELNGYIEDCEKKGIPMTNSGRSRAEVGTP